MVRLLHEHEVAVHTTTQPGNCSPPRLAHTALERWSIDLLGSKYVCG